MRLPPVSLSAITSLSRPASGELAHRPPESDARVVVVRRAGRPAPGRPRAAARRRRRRGTTVSARRPTARCSDRRPSGRRGRPRSRRPAPASPAATRDRSRRRSAGPPRRRSARPSRKACSKARRWLSVSMVPPLLDATTRTVRSIRSPSTRGDLVGVGAVEDGQVGAGRAGDDLGRERRATHAGEDDAVEAVGTDPLPQLAQLGQQRLRRASAGPASRAAAPPRARRSDPTERRVLGRQPGGDPGEVGGGRRRNPRRPGPRRSRAGPGRPGLRFLREPLELGLRRCQQVVPGRLELLDASSSSTWTTSSMSMPAEARSAMTWRASA